jgi:hypothetical protein
MSDRLKSLSECAQIRTKVCRKYQCWFVRLVYDPRELLEVTIARLEAEVLQMVSEPTLVVSRTRMSHLRRIQ